MVGSLSWDPIPLVIAMERLDSAVRLEVEYGGSIYLNISGSGVALVASPHICCGGYGGTAFTKGTVIVASGSAAWPIFRAAEKLFLIRSTIIEIRHPNLNAKGLNMQCSADVKYSLVFP